MDDAQDRAPLRVAVTVDVDPDANRAVPGRPAAVSAGAEQARFEACFAGLDALAETLAARRLPATLFWEGRTLSELTRRRPALLERLKGEAWEHAGHGHRHEDFAGEVSGTPLDLGEVRAALQQAEAAFVGAFGGRPRGFRAPYCRLTPALTQTLVELGYAYDASLARPCPGEGPVRPYPLPDAPQLYELPLCYGTDREGRRISGYLWQLFEGRRPARDYVELAGQAREASPGGLFQLALHPWHLLVSAEGRPLPGGQARGAARLALVLDMVERLGGIEFTTLGAYLDSVTGADEAESPNR